MRYQFAKVGKFIQAAAAEPDKWLRFDLSPGGACAELGVSRQRVYQLIAAGKLDAVAAGKERDGYPSLVLLDSRQVKARSKESLTPGRPRRSIVA